MTRYNALYQRNDIDRPKVLRKENRRGHANIKDNVDVSIGGFEEYIKKCVERLITGSCHSNEKIGRNKEYKNKLGKWNQQKINYMNISSDKLVKCHSGRHADGYGKETLK